MSTMNNNASGNTQNAVKPHPHKSVNEGSSAEARQDGGAFAWLQCAGTFFLFFNSWGLVNMFGAYQTFYERSLLTEQSSSQIAWIGSLQAFLFIIGGVIAGPLYDHGHLRALVRVGSFLVVFGMMMTSLASRYWHLVLAQGLTIGLGNGCLFVPSVALLPTYFVRHRALATGIAITGGNLGGVVYAIIFDRLQSSLGFGWATRIIGFVMLATLVLPNFCMKMRLKPPSARPFFDSRAWTELPFLVFALACFLGFLGLYVPYFFVQSFAEQKHIFDDTLAFYLVPVLNAGALIGRLVLCSIADYTGPVNVLFACALGSAILGYAWAAVTSQAAMVVFALLYGAFSGTYISLALTTIAVWLCPRLDALGARTGMICIPCAAGFLVGSPVGGAIVLRGWLGLQLFTGTALAVSTATIGMFRVMKVGWQLHRKS